LERRYYKSLSIPVLLPSGEEVYNEIQEFVENNCEIQENEVEQDLIDDLVRQVGL